MPTVSIRRFQSEDGPSVQDMISRIMDGEFREAKNAYPADDLQDIAHSYGKLGEVFFVAVNGQKVIGSVAIKREDDRTALLRRWFVSSDYRNKKIGLQLIDRALEFCKEVGYKEVIFRTTSQMESAARACQRRGFVPRAKLKMGEVELCKFALSLRRSPKPAAKKT